MSPGSRQVQLATAGHDDVARPELSAAPRLRLAVDPHVAVAQQLASGTTGVDDADQLEQLAEADAVGADVDRLGLHGADATTGLP